MSSDTYEPKKHLVLSGRDQIKGYVHPTRMVLTRMLAKEKRTVSSVAKELDVHPANITHHFKLLEKVGLIRLVEKRDTGKNLEKYYRAAAYHFSVKPATDRGGNKKSLALSILRNDLSIAMDTIERDDSRTVLALLGTARLDADDVDEFEKKIKGILREFTSRKSTKGAAFNINMSIYPNDTDRIPKEKVIIQ